MSGRVSRPPFDLEGIIAYLRACLWGGLQSSLAGLDSNRLTLAYFCVSGLDLLGELRDDDRTRVHEWVLSLQKDTKSSPTVAGGFRGSPFYKERSDHHSSTAAQACGEQGGVPNEVDGGGCCCFSWDRSHIAMTYTALALCLICHGSLDGVDKPGVTRLVAELQNEDGSMRAHQGDCESDARFIFCAAACCHMIDDWSGFNRDAAEKYIESCRTYEGGYGLVPGQEAHGGSTYCCVAALSLMGRLEALSDGDARERLITWCIRRQVGGFQGRCNKPADTCYSFWIGATLKAVGAYHLVDVGAFTDFSHMCQASTGGFSKGIGGKADALHTYMAISGLSLGQDSEASDSSDSTPRFKKLCPVLGFAECATRGCAFVPKYPWEERFGGGMSSGNSSTADPALDLPK